MRTLKRRGLLGDPVDGRDPGEQDPMTSCGQFALRNGKLGRVDEQGRVLPEHVLYLYGMCYDDSGRCAFGRARRQSRFYN